MLSMFIVQHETFDTFSLSEFEWKEAVNKYPELEYEDEILNFYPKSADSWIEPKKDNYFDSKVILRQFERLFKLLKFKKEFKGSEIEIIVDNARTHSAKIYDVNSFTNIPVRIVLIKISNGLKMAKKK